MSSAIRCARPVAVLERGQLAAARCARSSILPQALRASQAVAARAGGRSASWQPRVAHVRYATSYTHKSPEPPAVDRSKSKLYASADEAVADIKSGSVILSSGFGLCGVAGLSTFAWLLPSFRVSLEICLT